MYFQLARRRRRKILRFCPPLISGPRGGNFFAPPPYFGTQGGQLKNHCPPLWGGKKQPLDNISTKFQNFKTNIFFQIQKKCTRKDMLFIDLSSIKKNCYISHSTSIAFRNYLPISSIVCNTICYAKYTQVMHFQNNQKQCLQNLQKHSSSEKPFYTTKMQKCSKNIILIQMSIRRNVVKCRNRNTSQLISAIKTNPEMLSRRDYQHNVFENLQTQTLNSNKIHLRSKHYTPLRVWVPTL